MTDVYGTHESFVSDVSRENLTEIKGIGTTFAERLYNAKIVSVRQIAEMTPERLSETPGIGLVTATKFIAAAKNHLEGSQDEDIDSELIQIQEETKVGSTSTPLDHYEVEEVIVEEVNEISEESQIEAQEEFKRSQTDPKWFPDKYKYSRLTTSYPPISKRDKNINEKVEEEDTVVEPKTKEFAANVEFDTQPEIEQLNEYEEDHEEETIRKTIPEIQVIRDQSELKNSIDIVESDYQPIEPKSIDFEDSRSSSFNSSIHQQISKAFKEAGCYEIPHSLETLKQFTTNLDYLGCKLVKATDDLKILLLFPVKWFNQEGTVLVDETKLELKLYSKKNNIGAYNDIEQITRDLLQVRNLMNEDIAKDRKILKFFQKYLQITLSSEKGFGNNSLFFLSGTTQYKVYIEPILVCSNPPRSMERSLAFPYQRNTNLHAVTYHDLAPLVRFLEKKYRMIEKRTKKSSSVKDYKLAEETFSSNIKYASIPIFGYSVVLLVIYFAELYFLLRLFNTIGFAVLGIYLTLLTFFYFRAYNTKKKFTDLFETPYYLQDLEFSETDLLDFREELTDELLTQFGYECLRNDAKFGVIEQSEKKALKQSLETKRTEPELPKIFEHEQVKTKIVSKPATKYMGKYSSFLEDT